MAKYITIPVGLAPAPGINQWTYSVIPSGAGLNECVSVAVIDLTSGVTIGPAGTVNGSFNILVSCEEGEDCGTGPIQITVNVEYEDPITGDPCPQQQIYTINCNQNGDCEWALSATALCQDTNEEGSGWKITILVDGQPVPAGWNVYVGKEWGCVQGVAPISCPTPAPFDEFVMPNTYIVPIENFDENIEIFNDGECAFIIVEDTQGCSQFTVVQAFCDNIPCNTPVPASKNYLQEQSIPIDPNTGEPILPPDSPLIGEYMGDVIPMPFYEVELDIPSGAQAGDIFFIDIACSSIGGVLIEVLETGTSTVLTSTTDYVGVGVVGCWTPSVGGWYEVLDDTLLTNGAAAPYTACDPDGLDYAYSEDLCPQTPFTVPWTTPSGQYPENVNCGIPIPGTEIARLGRIGWTHDGIQTSVTLKATKNPDFVTATAIPCALPQASDQIGLLKMHYHCPCEDTCLTEITNLTVSACNPDGTVTVSFDYQVTNATVPVSIAYSSIAFPSAAFLDGGLPASGNYSFDVPAHGQGGFIPPSGNLESSIQVIHPACNATEFIDIPFCECPSISVFITNGVNQVVDENDAWLLEATVAIQDGDGNNLNPDQYADFISVSVELPDSSIVPMTQGGPGSLNVFSYLDPDVDLVDAGTYVVMVDYLFDPADECDDNTDVTLTVNPGCDISVTGSIRMTCPGAGGPVSACTGTENSVWTSTPFSITTTIPLVDIEVWSTDVTPVLLDTIAVNIDPSTIAANQEIGCYTPTGTGLAGDNITIRIVDSSDPSCFEEFAAVVSDCGSQTAQFVAGSIGSGDNLLDLRVLGFRVGPAGTQYNLPANVDLRVSGTDDPSIVALLQDAVEDVLDNELPESPVTYSAVNVTLNQTTSEILDFTVEVVNASIDLSTFDYRINAAADFVSGGTTLVSTQFI